MRKKNYVLLAVFCFILAFTACSKDDDDNGPGFAPDGKRLVSKMVYEDRTSGDDWKDEFTFSYNGEGKMTRIEEYTDYLDGYWKKEVYDISWNDKDIQMTFTESAEGEQTVKDSYTGKLNAEGYVISGVHHDEEGDEDYSYNYTYNSNGNLISVKEEDREAEIYTWQDGNCVGISYYYNSQNTCTFGTDENKANIDFVLFLRTCDLEFLSGWFGKGSRMLPTMVEQSFYDYVLDDEGYVTAVKSRDGMSTVTVTYN